MTAMLSAAVFMVIMVAFHIGIIGEVLYESQPIKKYINYPS